MNRIESQGIGERMIRLLISIGSIACSFAYALYCGFMLFSASVMNWKVGPVDVGYKILIPLFLPGVAGIASLKLGMHFFPSVFDGHALLISIYAACIGLVCALLISLLPITRIVV